MTPYGPTEYDAIAARDGRPAADAFRVLTMAEMLAGISRERATIAAALARLEDPAHECDEAERAERVRLRARRTELGETAARLGAEYAARLADLPDKPETP